MSIAFHLDKALYLSRAGRPGPVWIDIPLDVQAAQVEVDASRFSPERQTSSADAESLRASVSDTLALLKQAERPVILLGNGVRLANAVEEFRCVVEKLRIPVLTSWKAIDLATSVPLIAAARVRWDNAAQISRSRTATFCSRLERGWISARRANNQAALARGAKK